MTNVYVLPPDDKTNDTYVLYIFNTIMIFNTQQY